MQNIFKYELWFKALSLKISEMSQEELCTKAKQVNWGDSPPLLKDEYLDFGSGSVDPFSFLNSLVNRKESQDTITSAHSEFGVGADLPNFEEPEECVLPAAKRQSDILFHLGKLETMQEKEIWTLFEQAVKGRDSVQERDFDAVSVQHGPNKLTSVLYLVNSDAFPVYPAGTWAFGIKRKPRLSWEDYKAFVSEETEKFPGCEPYEMSRVRYWCDKGKEIDFANDPVVHSVGDDEWQRIRDEQQFENRTQRDFNKGAIVLFHLQGSSKALGIGTVYGNGFGTMPVEEGKVNVLWLGKEARDLGTNEPSVDAFREAYRDTFEFIAQVKKRSIAMQAKTESSARKEPLNQILYGPPGTGKTHEAGELAKEIAKEGPIKSFQDKQQEIEQITMVTFHQSYSYEDFVEGIRPVLDTNAGDVRYEMKKGIFRKICDAAKDSPDANFVLIIDEINRGNIAKIFGELITLIEDSKRAGAKDELSVKLPYSEDPLAVPKNLYIIGTMNTADRSIALLDTALRRRFIFVEMMPERGYKLIPEDIEGVKCRELLEKINKQITTLLDREKQIGYTYLLNLESLDGLKDAFQRKICPLLSEYFYDDWDKIEEILGKALVDGEQQQWTPFDEPAWDAPQSYIAIYKKAA